MEHGRFFERSSGASGRGRGECGRTACVGWIGGSGPRSDGGSAQGRAGAGRLNPLKAPDTLVAEVGRGHDDAPPASRTRESRNERLIAQYRKVRNFSAHLCRNLEPEDYVVQSMPDVSPTKWHLAHTSWFFATFVVKPHDPSYVPVDEGYAFLFNSYYVHAGERHCRAQRGYISRPTVAEVFEYRRHVDAAMARLIENADDRLLEV